MSELPRPRPAVEPARSFDLVADAYDRSRPAYPDDALTWLLQDAPAAGGTTEVLELGAGTGILTQQLLARGCAVTATDPSEGMLARLARRAPEARVVVGTAEEVPAARRSADLVVAAQAFSWFDVDRTIQEVMRVLRPGGRLAVVWSVRDERIPWVRRLGGILGTAGDGDGEHDPTSALDEVGTFETVERATFRFWQRLTPASLRDLVTSQPDVATMSDFERERVLRKVDELYAEYGRGADGMLLPYVTTAVRTTVLPWALPEDPAEPEPAHEATGRPGSSDGHGGGADPLDDDALLIDFR